MSTHNISFYEDLTKLSLNYHQIRTLFLLLIMNVNNRTESEQTLHSTEADMVLRCKSYMSNVTNRTVQPQKMVTGLKFLI